MKFTPEQTARGLATTISRGDYSVAAARFAQVAPAKRPAVLTALKAAIGADLYRIFARYIDSATARNPGATTLRKRVKD